MLNFVNSKKCWTKKKIWGGGDLQFSSVGVQVTTGCVATKQQPRFESKVQVQVIIKLDYYI